MVMAELRPSVRFALVARPQVSKKPLNLIKALP